MVGVIICYIWGGGKNGNFGVTYTCNLYMAPQCHEVVCSTSPSMGDMVTQTDIRKAFFADTDSDNLVVALTFMLWNAR